MRGTAKTLPFLPAFVPALREGRKTMTARTRRYGDPGAILNTAAGPIVLREVRRVELREVRTRYWLEEGCESPDDFKAVWERLHPRSGWQPDQKVWLHRFERVRPASKAGSA